MVFADQISSSKPCDSCSLCWRKLRQRLVEVKGEVRRQLVAPLLNLAVQLLFKGCGGICVLLACSILMFDSLCEINIRTGNEETLANSRKQDAVRNLREKVVVEECLCGGVGGGV